MAAGPTDDPFELARFVDAQADDYATAVAEVRAGRKRLHWMWYVFPQLDGLGGSPMAKRYAIRSAAEARAYLAHPLLGPRLAEVAAAAADVSVGSARDVFGTPDDLKLRSSATLFAAVSPPASVYQRVLDRYFDGRPDPATERLLAAAE